MLYVQSNSSTSSWNTTTNLSNTVITAAPGAPKIPPGPYFFDPHRRSIHRAYRLYADTANAFTSSLLQSSNSNRGNFTTLPAAITGQSLTLAVPSRLYYSLSADQPIAGLRVGIKDIYDLSGVRTGNGNRAWYRTHEPAGANALPVQNLIDAGAVIVGKMYTSQFANGETATADWVDYHEPFNPRGDGYEDTSSSSAGPGAGEGTYSWLDITLGSDTGGSVRGPSQAQGLFGNRPSWGLVGLDGVMPLAPALDTAGLLARDPKVDNNLVRAFTQSADHTQTHRDVARALYKSNWTTSYHSFPTNIYTVSFPTNSSTDLNAAVNRFLGGLSAFLGSNTTIVPLNFTAAFANTAPPSSPTRDLVQLTNITYPILISQGQTRLLRDPWFASYASSFQGRRPFVDPAPLVRWGFGDSYPASTSTEALTNKTIFADWFSSNVLRSSAQTCSDSLLLYIGSSATANPRNLYLDPPSVPYGFDSARVSVLSGAPDFVIPVGEARYNSTITGLEEVLPVTVDMMAAAGCDGMLFDLIEGLAEKGVVTASRVGRSLVSGGEVLTKRSVGEVQ